MKSQIYFMCKSDSEHTFVLDLGMSQIMPHTLVLSNLHQGTTKKKVY